MFFFQITVVLILNFLFDFHTYFFNSIEVLDTLIDFLINGYENDVVFFYVHVQFNIVEVEHLEHLIKVVKIKDTNFSSYIYLFLDNFQIDIDQIIVVSNFFYDDTVLVFHQQFVFIRVEQDTVVVTVV